MFQPHQEPEPAQIHSTPLRSNRMALPPTDLPGVVVVLKIAESYLLLDWMNKSAANLEHAISEARAAKAQIEDLTFRMLNTIAVGTQACHSAVAASAIYDNSPPESRLHFIHLNQFDAITIIQMLENTQSEVADELHANIIAQVDNAFIKRDTFANLPPYTG